MRLCARSILTLALAGVFSVPGNVHGGESAECGREDPSPPIRSAAQAICVVRSLSGPVPGPPDLEATYSAARVGPVWRVSIVPPAGIDVGGAYVVDLDAESGRVVTPKGGS